MIIDHVAVATNVVTLTVTIVEGDIPDIDDLIYVYATTKNSGGLNENTGIAISAVSITATTGKGTVSYPKTTADLTITADSGYAIVTPSEEAETLVPSQAYRAFAIPKLVPQNGANRSITVTVSFPSAPASYKWSMQCSMRNIDAEFVDIIKDVTTGGGTFSDSGAPGFASASTQFWPGSWNFVRFADTGSSGGTLPTVIAKLLI